MQTDGNRLPAKSAVGGWHWAEWGCEAVGTTTLLCVVVLVVHSVFAPGSRLAATFPTLHARLLLIGLFAGGTGAIFAQSPWGRRSGAHLNPAVSLAFWLRGQMHPHDLAGYSVAQLAGSVVGVVFAWWLGGAGVARPPVRYGMLAPSPQWPWWQAGLGETLMTTVLILLIFVCLSRPNLVRWTAWVAALVIALCIWLAGSYTGACLNPARIFGPALISGVYGGIFFYSVFPFLGSFCAVAIWQLGGNHRLLTSKLVHDAAYATTMATHLPTAPHP